MPDDALFAGQSAECGEGESKYVFISYSHDSHAHQHHVLEFANRLRSDGINAVIDQYSLAPSEGWPRWMERHIEGAEYVLVVCTATYSRRARLAEQPDRGFGVLWESNLIYNAMYRSRTINERFIPIVFDAADYEHIPPPLQGSTCFVVSEQEGYTGLCRLITSTTKGDTFAQRPFKPVLQEQSLLGRRAQPTAPSGRVRARTLNRLQNTWVKGVLQNSLYQIAHVELNVNQVSTPANERLLPVHVVSDGQATHLMPARDSLATFDREGGLLTLGGPGSGKTTLLAELLSALLARAEAEDSYPVPAIFNLTSWRSDLTMHEWLARELTELYDVPRRFARQWTVEDRIVPLLDGLDELSPAAAPACVAAINQFRIDSSVPVAVCSRRAEYEALSVRLRLPTAIVIDRITTTQIEQLLRSNELLKPLGDAIRNEPELLEVLDTPLMLFLAVMTYLHDNRSTTSSAALASTRRTELVARYIEAMFMRRPPSLFGRDLTVQWLTYLARWMVEEGMSVFHLEALAGFAVPTKGWRTVVKIGSRFFAAALAGVLAAAVGIIPTAIVVVGLLRYTWKEAAALSVLTLALGTAVSVALNSASEDLRSVEVLRLQWSLMWRDLWTRVRLGFAEGGLSFNNDPGTSLMLALGRGAFRKGLIFTAACAIAILLFQITRVKSTSDPVFSVLVIGLDTAMYSLLVSVFFGIADALQIGLLIGDMDTKIRPNEGFWRSLRNAAVASAVVGGGVWLVSGLLVFITLLALVFLGGASIERSIILIAAVSLIVVTPISIVVSIVTGARTGGLFCVSHLWLRLCMWWTRRAPIRYAAFLEETASQLLLRRVGGGYTFTHRILLDYFASGACFRDSGDHDGESGRT